MDCEQSRPKPLLLSLFCGAGGLDLGFEQAGFRIALALDKNKDSISSYNHNRPTDAVGKCENIRQLDLVRLDELHGGTLAPVGVIGGPPCQSFSSANNGIEDTDPRHELPLIFAKLLKQLNDRNPVQFFVMENVPGLCRDEHLKKFRRIKKAFRNAGFRVFQQVLNARDFKTPQNRERLFLVGLNAAFLQGLKWKAPSATTENEQDVTVEAAIGGLPEPALFSRSLKPTDIPHHPNHWCMQPKSAKFTRPGALAPGNGSGKSFKTLAWSRPSITVAYGNREVHIHPDCHRRLSVYEAMRLQGFPHAYELQGNLSSQITQVSEAVPPGMAHAVALSVKAVLNAAEGAM